MYTIDLHCDTIFRLMEDKEKLGLACNPFHVDIQKLKKANTMAQVFALYVNLRQSENPLETCLEMLDKFYLELKQNHYEIAVARNYEELKENWQQAKISAILAIEEGGVIKGRLYHLRNYYRLGVRLMTLTWNYPNEIGFPNTSNGFKNMGLTSFGKGLIEEMNTIGMLIDVAHLSDQGFYDVAALSKYPFIASHSNARTIKNHPRNLTDEMIRILAEKGGVMGINFASCFLGNGESSRVEDMIYHIKHIKKIAGVDVIAIGSDFDGISPPLEIENIGQIYKLIDALSMNGFTDEEIEKICYRNALRVIKEVLK